MKILFVCHGNICRSPMAEFIMKDLTKDLNYEIISRATSYEEIGNDLYYETKNILNKYHIPYTRHFATRITKEEYSEYDYIIVMDDNNLYNLKRIVGHIDVNKVFKLNYFNGNLNDVEDPWYTRNFEKCYSEIKNGCIKLLKYINKDI